MICFHHLSKSVNTFIAKQKIRTQMSDMITYSCNPDVRSQNLYTVVCSLSTCDRCQQQTGCYLHFPEKNICLPLYTNNPRWFKMATSNSFGKVYGEANGKMLPKDSDLFNNDIEVNIPQNKKDIGSQNTRTETTKQLTILFTAQTKMPMNQFSIKNIPCYFHITKLPYCYLIWR